MKSFDRLLGFFSQASYTDPESHRQAVLTQGLLRILLVASLMIYLVMFTSTAQQVVFIIATSLLLVNLVAYILLRTGRLRLSGLVLVIGLLALVNTVAVLGGGVRGVPYIANIIVVLTAGLLLGGTGSLIVALIAAFTGFGLVIAETNNFLIASMLPSTPLGFWFTAVVIFFASASFIYLATQSLREAHLVIQQKEQAELENQSQLEAVRQNLEEQILERTQVLEQRTSYLQALVEVTQSTASMLDVARLMSTAVDLIKEQFRLYYVGLFVVEPGGDWAALRAGTGEAGQAMLNRGHRIRVGSGMIGWSIANAQPRIAGEAGQDVVRLVNPDLPETRSEAAIPLRSRGRVIGALSVQSERPNAFGETEIAAFQALADQVGIALDNARLYTESQKALEEAHQAYGSSARRSWQDFLATMQNLNLTYRHGTIETAQSASGSINDARQQVIQTGKPAQIQTDQGAMLFLPIPVRDLQIGAISFTKEALREGETTPHWSRDEIDLLQNIVNQMGIALDSARLYQDTQRLAFREQLTGEVTSRIRQTLDIQTVLRTAVEEVQRALSLPEVVISLAAPETASELASEPVPVRVMLTGEAASDPEQGGDEPPLFSPDGDKEAEGAGEPAPGLPTAAQDDLEPTDSVVEAQPESEPVKPEL